MLYFSLGLKSDCYVANILSGYCAIKNYIVPQIGKMYMSTLNQGYIRKLYNAVAEKYESVAKNVRTIMKTSLEYAFNKNVLATNPAKGINLPKKIKKTEYRVLKIDEKKTLTLPQVLRNVIKLRISIVISSTDIHYVCW